MLGSGQMLLAALAMFLLGIIILSANSTLFDNEQTVRDSEFGVAAISLATSLVEEAQGKVFDEAASDSGVTTTAQLTLGTMLGPDPSEQYRTVDTSKHDFDDLDDFNGFSVEFVNDSTQPQIATYRGNSRGFRADYLLRSKVEYVVAGGGFADLDGSTLTQTWHKKITVTVTSPSSKDTLVFPTVISYWN